MNLGSCLTLFGAATSILGMILEAVAIGRHRRHRLVPRPEDAPGPLADHAPGPGMHLLLQGSILLVPRAPGCVETTGRESATASMAAITS